MSNAVFLKLVLRASGFRTYSQMAMELKISHSMISHIRNGKRNVTASLILAVHEYLGIPVIEIRNVLSGKSNEFRS